MKSIITVILIFLQINIGFFTETNNNDFEDAAKQVPNNSNDLVNPLDSDKTLERIKYYVTEFALINDRKVDLLQKQINTGNLPDGFPKEMRLKAKQERHNEETWNKVMKNPTEVWRGCIYPNFTLGFHSYCKQKFAFSGIQKLNGCYNNFCMVCCDNLIKTFTTVANTEKLGFMLDLDNNIGKNNIKLITSDSEINKCRLACKKQYPISMPIILPSPPRDKLLGVNIENAAMSCMDIKTWGNENAGNGEYWLDLGVKGKQKAYCDMETDNGGWTLFFNYKHKPNMDLILDSTVRNLI